MNEWVAETNGLSKKLGGRAVVSDLNMKIGKGDIYGFLGPNGAGKTTSIRMLLGLAKPTAGSVRIFGRDIRKERLAVLRKVGSLVEYPSYYGHLSAYDNLEAVRRLLDAPKSRIDEVLAVVRLTKDAKRPVKGYSLGMKQRLGIATALLGDRLEAVAGAAGDAHAGVLREIYAYHGNGGDHAAAVSRRAAAGRHRARFLRAAPLAVNVILTLPNILVVNSEDYAPYYPWAQPMLAMLPKGMGPSEFGAFGLSAVALFGVILGSFAVFFAGGWLYFTRKAV